MKQLFLSLVLIAGVSLPGMASENNGNIQLAQASNTDYQVSVMEEQIRQLNGKIEELNFQLLEMQERMRRMQEDNEFRFQQIEEKQGNLGTGGGETVVADDEGFIRLEKPEPSESTELAIGSDGNTNSQADQGVATLDGVEIFQGEASIDDNIGGSLGTLQFDANGNIVDSNLGKPLDLTAGLQNGGVNAPLPQDPDALFTLGYDNLQSGRYEDAETALIAFSDQYATHPRLPEARFWLGESYLGRGQYKTAAEVYLDVHKRWPNGKYGPQSLLKLGVSIAGMNQRELACATFAEVIEKYPNASRAIQRAVAFEQRSAQCAIN